MYVISQLEMSKLVPSVRVNRTEIQREERVGRRLARLTRFSFVRAGARQVLNIDQPVWAQRRTSYISGPAHFLHPHNVNLSRRTSFRGPKWKEH